MKISELRLNPGNPRTIKDKAFEKLKNSIKEFPKMMALRPIVYDPESMEVLGGNMRLRALIDLGYKKIPDEWVKPASDFTEEELKRFQIIDNLSYGEWSWEDIANEWDENLLKDWGMDIPVMPEIEPESTVNSNSFQLKITLENEKDLNDLFFELSEKGYSVKII